MADFEEASQTFLSWLSKSGAEISNKIELRDLRAVNAGRGVGTGSLFAFQDYFLSLLHVSWITVLTFLQLRRKT
jgi:hypothetical protein